MQISLLTVVTFMNVLVSAEASTFMRGGSANSDKDTNSNHRSLALSECSDSGEVLYKDKTCDWISAINNKKKMKSKCNKKTKLGRIYDLCPSTCSGVDLGPCTTSKLGETIKALRAAITDLDAPITDEDEDNDTPANDLSATIKDMKAEKEALEAELAGFRDTISKMNTIIEEKDAAIMTSKQATSDCVAVNAEKVAVLEEQKLSLDEIIVLKDAELAGFGDTISEMNTIIEEKDEDFKDLVATKDEAFKIIVAKDVEIESLRTKVEDLKASLASTTSPTTSPTKSPTKSPTNSLLIIANKDEELENLDEANDSLRETCNKLTVLKDNACVQVPVDCVKGKERGTGKTCQKACDGQCCTTTSTKSHETPCTGFTGLIHRDGSCTGAHACQSGTVDEVKGPSCKGRGACNGGKIGVVKESCKGEYVCQDMEVDLIEGSCTGSTSWICYGIHATSIVNGEVSGQFDPREICVDECKSSEEEGGSEAYYDCLYRCDDLYF